MSEELNGKVNGHGTTEAAIVTAATAALTANDETVEQKLARAEKQVAFRKGILSLIAANLEPSDIALYGEGEKQTIHLTKHACKQILSWAGVTVQPDNNIQEKRYEGVDGPYIDFEVWATWLTPDGRYYRTMGNRSTYDDFYAKRTKTACRECGAVIRWIDNRAWCPACNKAVNYEKTTYYLPLSEVDIPAIKQAAITNLWNHVVEDAGLKPSKRELEKAGFNFSDVKDRVTFNQDKAPQQTSQKPAKQAPPAKREASPTGPAQTANAPAAAGPAPSGVPKAQIPKDEKPKQQQAPLAIGKGIISEVREKTTKPNKAGKGGGTPYLEVVQNGNFLYCFQNHELETRYGPEKAFTLIKNANGLFCEFTVDSKVKAGKDMHAIVGATRIGNHQWDRETGQPVGGAGSDPDGYAATDEDIPF